MSEKYLDVPMSYYHDNPTGELLAHADADVVGTTNSIKPLPFSIGVVVLIVFALISLWLVDWTFAVVALVLFPALALLNRRYTNRVHRPVTLGQERLGKVSTIAHESFDGVLVVKTLGLVESETERFAVQADALREADLEAGRIRAGFDPVLDALPSLGTLLLFVVGGGRISQGAVTPGDLVQARAAVLDPRLPDARVRLLPPGDAASRRVDRPHRPGRPRHRTRPARSVGPRSTLPERRGRDRAARRDVRVRGRARARDVSFDVRPGEILAVVGPTGSGKSTLTNLLVRLVEPTSGTIEVNGVPADRLDPDELRAAVSLVFQESFLFATSLRDNIALDDLPPRAGGRRRRHRPRHALRRAPAPGLEDDGGRARRHALGWPAAACGAGPRARPPAEGADPRRRHVRRRPVIEAQILGGLRSRGGMTLVIVAHRLSTIKLADRVVYLEAGRVGGVGTHQELVSTVSGYETLVRAYEEEGWTPGDGGDDDRPGVAA